MRSGINAVPTPRMVEIDMDRTDGRTPDVHGGRSRSPSPNTPTTYTGRGPGRGTPDFDEDS